MYVLENHIKLKQEMQYIFFCTGNKWNHFYNEAIFISLPSVFN